jgi:phosphoesterase RecJ-like protein
MSRAQVVELIRRGQRFLVTCHVRPDADALGSALGLASVLRAHGKEAIVYSEGGVPGSVGFLEGADSVRATLPAGRFDATFITDTAAQQLVPGLPEASERGPVVMVDHHAAHDDFGDVMLREVDAAATAEVVLRLHDALGAAPLPREAAQPLYAALVADTGGFRYSQTRPETLRLAARLLDLGVDPWDVASRLFERWAPPRMALLGEVLRATTVELDGRVTMVCIDRAMLERTGASDDMIEGMVNYGRMLEGVQAAALLWEPTGKAGVEAKLSLRAGAGVDVARVAVALGGGGHRSAAGATLPGTLADARARVLAELARGL